MCRSQSPGSPTPGSPSLDEQLFHPLDPNCHFCEVSAIPGDPSGSLADEPPGDEGVCLGKQGVHPVDQNECLPPTCSSVVKMAKRRIMFDLIKFMTVVMVVMMRPSSIRIPSSRCRSRSIRQRSSQIWERISSGQQLVSSSSSFLSTDCVKQRVGT